MFSGGPRGAAGVRQSFGAQSTAAGVQMSRGGGRWQRRGIRRFHDILSQRLSGLSLRWRRGMLTEKIQKHSSPGLDGDPQIVAPRMPLVSFVK